MIKLSNLRAIPKVIWTLGFVSLLMDISSDLVRSLLPIFMVTTLGASVTSVGLVEGIAEATSLISRIFSGSLSDYFGKRKPLIMFGYGLAALTKPLFPLANSIGMVLTARFLDRIGKGIRSAPRDALIGDVAPKEIRGACFGLRQSLDTVGAFLGPVLAIIAMLLLAGNIRAVLWLAFIPALASFLLLFYGVKEPEVTRNKQVSSFPIIFHEIRSVGKGYWQLVAVAGVLTLARFSEAFLILKAQTIGMPISYVPLVLIIMNLVYMFGAYPAGMLSDSFDRKKVLFVGVVFLLLADIVLGFTDNFWMLTLGIALWGLHMAFSQGILATMVTDTTPEHLRGTAYGVFNFVCGIAMLGASVIAGLMWDAFGPSFTFFTGAGFTLLSGLGLVLLRERRPI